MNKPLLIVMTPVRNEAWILNVFFKATSLWADYIIIADQHSTDGSREIAMQYPKVILIDNDNTEFNEAERQKLLIDRARKIEGDKILFGLDADEIFSANYKDTNDWKNILNSKPGDVFWFRWANLCADQKHYWLPKTYYPWMFHDDGKELHGNYVRNIHSMRIPYPIEEKQMFYVNDFKVLHFAYLNTARVRSKNRFYKFVDWEMNKRSPTVLSRSYGQIKIKEDITDIPDSYLYNNGGFNLFEEVTAFSEKFWFDDYVIDRISKYDKHAVSKLDIWDEDFIQKNKCSDPRTWLVKIFHKYLKISDPYRNTFLVKFIDNLLKEIRF